MTEEERISLVLLRMRNARETLKEVPGPYGARFLEYGG